MLGTPTDTITYAYTDPSWGDLLTSYDGTTLLYDAIGNLAYDGEWTYAWQHGRQLQSMYDGTQEVSFTYDANGMRKTKTNGTLTYNYLYNGGQLTQMTRSDGNTLLYTYDTFGHPATVNWNGTVYYIITTLQGDVYSIRNSSGTSVVEYRYDPWGKILSITGSMADTLGALNPLTYRGYVYDHETGLYYLQSRYYNPEWGRFLNADALVATGQGMLGNNMFAYCRNNPACRVDISGAADADCLDVKGDDEIEIPADDPHFAGRPAAQPGGSGSSSGGLGPAGGGAPSTPSQGGGTPSAPSGPGGYTREDEKTEIHHIVEQCQAKKSGFDKVDIDGNRNKADVAYSLHRKISGYYSSKPDGSSVRVRDSLVGMSFEEQLEYGKKLLDKFWEERYGEKDD